MCHSNKIIIILYKLLLFFIQKCFIKHFSHIHYHIMTYVIGHLKFTVEDVRGTWNLMGPVINDTWTVEHFRITPSIKNLKIYFNTFLEQNNGISKY